MLSHRQLQIGMVSMGLLLTVAFCVYFFVLRFPDPWRPVANPHDVTCQSGCVEKGTLYIRHGPEIKILVRTSTDDETAQWGDCLESVVSCVEKGRGVRLCVEKSACPDPCKARVLRDASASDRLLLQSFDEVFLKPGAPCMPRKKEP